MHKSIFFLIITFFSLSIIACNNNTSINEDDASGVIEGYLETNPEYQTANFNFGEIKFKGENDKEELDKYRDLEDKGLITMTLQEEKKRFLSKDTSFTYLIELTDESAPYVLKQSNNKAVVKSATYSLDNSKPVNFVKVNEKTAKTTVSLKRVETDFYPFQKSNNSSDFITKTYRLKLKKDAGWEVIGE